MGFFQVEARETIKKMLDTLNFGLTECVVRVNSVSSGIMETDLKVVFEAETLPHTLMFPKVNSPQELVTVSVVIRNM